MTREQAEQIARKHNCTETTWWLGQVADAILEAVAIEREECAKVCDHMAEFAFGFKTGEYANKCAKAIRARSA